MRRIGRLSFAILLCLVCAGGIPTDRSIIEARERGRLTIVDGALRFTVSRNFEQAEVYLLGTLIKFREGGYLAHRADAEPGEELYLAANATHECHWSFDDRPLQQPRDTHRGGGRLSARIKISDGPLAGYYLAVGGPLARDFSASGRRTLGQEYRAILVRDREQAAVFEVRQWVIHK